MRYVFGFIVVYRTLCFASKLFNPPLYLSASTTGLKDVSQYFNWSSLKPLENLAWQPCYTDHQQNSTNSSIQQRFECARLVLPLDWQNISDQHRITLALIRLPSPVPSTDPRYGGSLLVNSGGSGSSGIDFLLEAGPYLQERLSLATNQTEATPLLYDLIAYDPRGVPRSTPNAHCFTGDRAAKVWDDQVWVAQGFSPANVSAGLSIAASSALGYMCEQGEFAGFDDGTNIRQYMSATYIARDMLEVIRKLENNTSSTEPASESDIQLLVNQQHLLSASTAVGRTEKPKLNYLGFSSGTFIGNVFASLYPEHVGKMILDGNVDPDDWLRPWLGTMLDDTEEIWHVLFTECAKSSNCALKEAAEDSATLIRARVNVLLEYIRHNPIWTVIDSEPQLITRADLVRGLWAALFAPYELFSPMAANLATLLSALNSTAGRMAPGIRPVLLPYSIPFYSSTSQSLCDDTSTSSTFESWKYNDDIRAATHCGDRASLANTTRIEVEIYLALLQKKDPWIGLLMAEPNVRCLGWPESLRPKWRYTGPFGFELDSLKRAPSSSQVNHRDKRAFSGEILFVNNRFDPASPLHNALNMAKRYPHSKILEVNSSGHCALAGPSSCAWSVVREFLRKSDGPRDHGWDEPKKLVCGVDQGIFSP